MKSLRIRPQVFKHLDSNTELTIDLISGIKGVQLNPEHSYKLKIKNNTGYLTEYDLEIKGNQLVLTTDKLKDFTPDDYEVEVWDSYEDKDSIYPDEDYGTFKIDKNVAEVDGKTIPVITIEEFNKRIDEALKKVESIEQIKGEKGDKGEKGGKGDTGERGADGKDGRDGVNGKDGTNGRDGIDGKNGQDGKSAYQIWLDIGNSGTEQDFINSLKAQSERHAPTGYALDTSTKPWTIWFDNGCGIQYPSYYNNPGIYGQGNTESNFGNDLSRSCPHKTMIRISNSSFRLYGYTNREIEVFASYDKNIKVINPIRTDADKFDWSGCYGNKNTKSDGSFDEELLQKKTQFARAVYEVGIWSEEDVIKFGAVRKV